MYLQAYSCTYLNEQFLWQSSEWSNLIARTNDSGFFFLNKDTHSIYMYIDSVIHFYKESWNKSWNPDEEKCWSVSLNLPTHTALITFGLPYSSSVYTSVYTSQFIPQCIPLINVYLNVYLSSMYTTHQCNSYVNLTSHQIKTDNTV